MRTISRVDIDNLVVEAIESPRKRAIYRLHEHEEPVQRMVNALVPGTYVTPHKHENPDKVELLSILKGRIAVLQFSEGGQVTNVIELDSGGSNTIVDIPPRMYHAIVVLEPSAILEIIQGPYDQATHKQFAPWAPPENSAQAGEYLADLTKIARNWNITQVG